MRVRVLLLWSLVAAASVAASCEGSSPLVGEGTNTPYDLSLTITSPGPTYAFKTAADSVAYSWEVVDNGTGLVVPNASLTSESFSAVGVVKVATCSSKLGDPYACLKAVKTGATTLTDTYLNANTGSTLSASSALTVP
jgi:hypothetical protein